MRRSRRAALPRSIWCLPTPSTDAWRSGAASRPSSGTCPAPLTSWIRWIVSAPANGPAHSWWAVFTDYSPAIQILRLICKWSIIVRKVGICKYCTVFRKVDIVLYCTVFRKVGIVLYCTVFRKVGIILYCIMLCCMVWSCTVVL